MKSSLFVVLIVFASCASAQLPEGSQHWDPISFEGKRIAESGARHTHIRPISPFIESEVVTFTRDSILTDTTKGKWRGFIRPVIDAQAGGSAGPSPGFSSFGSGGFSAAAAYRDRFYVRSNMQAGWLFFPDHLEIERIERGVITGIGPAHELGNAHYAPYLTGAAGMRMGEHFNLEIGHDKHFWGNGYRSLVLSHHAAPYTYGRLTTRFWKVKYTNLWTSMRHNMDPRNNGEVRIKYMTLHALSMQVSRRVNVTLYESIVWQGQDTLNRRGFEPAYLNPLIFYRPVEFAQGSADNVLLGAEISVDVYPGATAYAQFYFDEIQIGELRRALGWWGNKFAIQLGVKSFGVFADSLGLQSEFNIVRPFTYTHGSVVQTYGHFNQSLAHPLGANFIEWVNRARYYRNEWAFQGTFIFAQAGRNEEGLNLGGDVFTNDRGPWRQYGNKMLQGEPNTLLFLDAEAARKLGTHGLWGFVRVGGRALINRTGSPADAWVLFGIRTDLVRPYRDF